MASAFTPCQAAGPGTNTLEIGVRSMAVPVHDRAGGVIAAMSIAVRTERMGLSEFREAFLAPLMRARRTLEQRLFPG